MLLAEANKESNRSLVYLSSAKASTKAGTYFTTTLNKPIDRIKEVEVQGVCLPFTFYNIGDSNSCVGTYNGAPLYMPTGLYQTATDLLAGFNFPFVNQTLSIVNNKFVITSKTAFTITIDPTLPGAAAFGFTTAQTGLSVTADVSTVNNTPFYFRQANNVIQINLSGGTVGGFGGVSATIPTGYYDQTSYAAAIADRLLNNATLTGVTILAATVTYSSQTFGFNINITFNKTFTDAMVDLAFASAGELFTSTTGYSIVNSPASASLVISIPPPTGLIPKTLYVKSRAISAILTIPPQYNIIHKVIIPSSTTKKAKYSGADITPYQAIINGVPGKIIIDEAEYQIPLIAAKRQSLSTLDFQLVDELYSPIFLNGLDWSIAIIITTN